MPLFQWLDALDILDWGPLSPWVLIKGEWELLDREPDAPTLAELDMTEEGRSALERQRAARTAFEGREQARLVRSRWLETNRAERSFPCGMVPDPARGASPTASAEPAATFRPMEVIAAVLPEDLVFVRAHGDGEEVEVVGRLARTEIQAIDVVDASGAHVPEPVEEAIEEPTLTWAILRWSNEGVSDEDRFAFRSAWAAWQAARRLLAAKG